MHKNQVAIEIVSKFMEENFTAILKTEDEAEAQRRIRGYEFLEQLKICLINDECPSMD